MSSYPTDSMLYAQSKSSRTELADSAVLTTVGSVRLPTDYMNAVGRAAWARFTGFTSCIDAGHQLNPTISFSIFDVGALSGFAPGIVTGEPWEIDVLFTTVTAGSSGSVQYSMLLKNLYADKLVSVGVGALSPDLDAHPNVDVFIAAQWGTADPGNVFTCTQAKVRLGGLVA